MKEMMKMVERVVALWRKLDVPADSRLTREGALGAGGMGTVDLVHDSSLLRRVARKTLHAEHLDKEQMVLQFVREVRITAALDHPFIIPVYEMGFNNQGQVFFTMKRISGKNLKDFIRELPEGRMPRQTLFAVLEVIVKICDALAFAHHRGVLHCDIKPDHVIMADYGQVYLIDWGIAHIMDHAVEPLTELRESSAINDEKVMGTVAFMSPEQAAGRVADLGPASDIFSLGAVLYSILARRAPYVAKTVAESVELAQHCEYTPLSEAAPPNSVPPELDHIVRKAMDPDPAKRFRSAGDLGDALRDFMGGGGDFPTIRFEEGERIVTQGDAGKCAYIIKSGRCEAIHEKEGEEISLEIIDEGNVFGELAILTGQNRAANVVALEGGVEVYEVKEEDFRAELNLLRPWIRQLVEKLAERATRRRLLGDY